MDGDMDVVTGSFGYIGRYITRELLDAGRQVRTITTHPDKPNPFGDRVTASPYNFSHPERLIENLRGCQELYNTYWVRFNYRDWSFEQALANTWVLFQCAKEAGIERIVQISVTNPSETDALPYYRGKALQEKALRECGLPYRIIRPTLVFGVEDILVNNIAWIIRTFPVIPIFGSGEYRVQPVYVGDLAKIAVNQSTSPESEIIDAIGPETYTYLEFNQQIARELDRRVRFVKSNPGLGIFLGNIISLFVRDVVLTRDELRGLMANKLTSSQAPNGTTRFSEWLVENKGTIGIRYTSELQRHFHWKK